jgi:hypothetical protein
MIAYSMILLASVMEYGFEVLDTYDSEWVAPGYEVVEEAVIDPLEYGEPYLSNGSPTVGVHVSFVESDSSEAWRVVFVLDRKVMVLQEGEEPVEIPVDLDIARCAFSPSGRYVVAHDGAEVYTGQNAARIDTWSGEAEIFDSQPDGELGPRGLLVADDGSITVGFLFFDGSLDITGSYRSIINPCWPTFSPLGSYFATGSNRGSRLYLLDKDGDVVWEKATGNTIATHMAFSPDERFLAIPFQTGLEVWDVATGETVWRDESGDYAETPIIGSDGDCMWMRGKRFEFQDNFISNGPEQVLTGYEGRYHSWRVIAATTDRVLLEMTEWVDRVPCQRRRTLVDDGNEVIWTSSASEVVLPGPAQQAGRAFRYDIGSIRFVLSPSGCGIGLAPGETVHLWTIQSLP